MPRVLRPSVRSVIFRALILVLVASTAACGLALTNEARLERAQEAYEAGDYRAAIIDLRNILQQEPDNASARVLLGRAAIRQGDPATADKELRRAIELGTPLHSVATDLGQAMLQLRQFNELLDEIRPELATDEETRL
ncbi:MAG TPA: tetratricopeptide repeat protein, partial [Woeseiaceae bacterium]|nr:tetratricopeptide repeat protein [Woeseiaceae bacterium]